ncbi:unnamed protein product [Schistocephalus solidus]|uniref:C2H2-type domain-containing protein n=1 Tax=Schistocephalus solidus TaxID=70667 RepID=A0A183T162_SCHSO|nr:unnamed protein product [Schistocephalus solidus]
MVILLSIGTDINPGVELMNTEPNFYQSSPTSHQQKTKAVANAPGAPRSWTLPSGHTPGNRHDRRAKPGEGLRCCVCLPAATPRATVTTGGLNQVRVSGVNSRATVTTGGLNQDWFDDNDTDISNLLAKKNGLHKSYLDLRTDATKAAFFRCRRLVQQRLREMQDAWMIRKANDIQGTDPAILTATFTPTTTNDIHPVPPDFSCPHCTFNSRIGLVGHLRIHRTEAGEPVPGAPALSCILEYRLAGLKDVRLVIRIGTGQGCLGGSSRGRVIIGRLLAERFESSAVPAKVRVCLAGDDESTISDHPELFVSVFARFVPCLRVTGWSLLFPHTTGFESSARSDASLAYSERQNWVPGDLCWMQTHDCLPCRVYARVKILLQLLLFHLPSSSFFFSSPPPQSSSVAIPLLVSSRKLSNPCAFSRAYDDIRGATRRPLVFRLAVHIGVLGGGIHWLLLRGSRTGSGVLTRLHAGPQDDGCKEKETDLQFPLD